MKRSIHIALLPLIAIATFSLTACGDRLPTSGWDRESDTGEASVTNQIMPLKVGNWWIYERHEITIAGGRTDYDTIRIVSEDRPPAGVPGAGNSFQDQKGRTYYYVGEELHVVQTNCTSTFYGELCGARATLPAIAGDTFGLRQVRENSPTPLTHDVVTVVDSAGSSVQTPAGSFDCYAFSHRGIVDDSTYAFGGFRYYYTPGTGLVRMTMTEAITDQISDIGLSLELIDYHVQ